jgi:5'/3'-nucleotidase SurE
MRMAQLRRLVALLLVLGLIAPGLAGAQSRSLKILLTNDDGFDSAGLKAMQTALAGAGHQVTVVAPAANQSSTSMSMTSGTLKVDNKGEGVWAVHGTPADAATIGLAHILRDTPQDLVVSGTNAGQNLGTSANGSGTVSAAIAAARLGVPAIATSAGLGADAGTAYDVAATLAIQMIGALAAARPANGKLLPDRLVINVNVPAVPAGKLRGIRWAPLSHRSSYTRVYAAGDNPGEVRSRLALSTEPLTEKDTDLALFNQGYVTLTLLDGDLGATAAASSAVSSLLSKLALPELARKD